MLDKIKNMIYQNIEELFTTAVTEDLAGDTKAYREKLDKISTLAELLGSKEEWRALVC